MHKRLLIPGPTEVSEEILREQTRPVISHRGKEFVALYSGIIDKINNFLQLPSDYKATVTTSSGTLWFHIVGRSIVKEKALCCINGAFASRFGETVRACGKQADFLEVEWGKAVKPNMIAEKLDSGAYDTLVLCHNESSTGVRNPIYEIGKMVRNNYPEVKLAEKYYMISNGYGKLAEKTFRIGHMGEWNLAGIKNVLEAIDEIWELAE